MGRNYSYYVAPRYTAGSPDAVDYETAHRVAREEHKAYYEHLEGHHGPENQERAKKLGLRGIVEERKVYARYYIAFDLLTFQRRGSRVNLNGG
ncbi:MAG: hypothetical protein NVS1B10_08420 [Candidatus Saccharimonadales bacterium]